MRKRGKRGGGGVIWVLLILGEGGRRELRGSAGNDRIEWRREKNGG
jgi:hypothetical protein